MGRLYWLVQGQWKKDNNGEWSFEELPSEQPESLIINRTDSYEGVVERTRITLNLGILTPVVLTYQQPEWMHLPDARTTPPTTLLCDEDVETMANIRETLSEGYLFVTSGPEHVAKYQFQRRYPFTVCDKTYLEAGVTEEQHEQDIKDLVGGHPIVCSKHMLEIMFNEPQLLIVFRVALEIQMVYANTRDAGEEFPRLTVDDVIEMAHGVTESPDDPYNYDPYDEVLYGEPMPLEEVARVFPVSQAPANGNPSSNGDNPHSQQPPTFTAPHAEFNEDAPYVNGMVDEDVSYEVYVHPAPPPPNAPIGRPVGLNRRISAAPFPSVIVIQDDDDASYTGSSDGLTENENIITLTPARAPPLVSGGNSTAAAIAGGNSLGGENGTPNEGSQVPVLGTTITNGTSTEPSLDLTLGVGPATADNEPETVVVIADSSSEAEDGTGQTPNRFDDVHQGKLFRSRAHFKQHMAIYALQHKFRFRNTRSSPDGMVLTCISSSCKWRIYATKLKNVENYEIRKVILEHTCSIDERAGYEQQATHNVIGEMIKSRYVGNGSGPRPNEIVQVMRGEYNVNISYWKAWRSREVAQQYAKGSSGKSYKLLPNYLNRLVIANPGTLADMETVYDAGMGNRFKYLFLALGASIAGFKHMRPVIIVDGAHLRGKYAGCLLTASAQDGNYQIFPLAVAIVDGENDNAWEWFFNMLLQFIPNEDNVVFISDRHSSIYNGITKVYPNAKHCACVLHLKRNIRTYFKNKHLGYLVGKAARAYRLSEFNMIFNEIKLINPSCADYLTGIGLDHWARAHFSGNRFNIMTSNVAESWNSVLREARAYPIMPLLEFIRSKMMKWFADRRNLLNEKSFRITPRVMEIVEANFEQSGGFLVSKINTLEFEVKDKTGAAFHVNLSNKSCTCISFQKLMIPCPHAIAAAIREKISVESLVAEVYSFDCLTAAYSNAIFPISDTEASFDGGLEAVEIFPPATRRPPGRPRKRRILSTGEIRMKSTRKKHLCTRCKGSGHNRATCKVPI